MSARAGLAAALALAAGGGDPEPVAPATVVDEDVDPTSFLAWLREQPQTSYRSESESAGVMARAWGALPVARLELERSNSNSFEQVRVVLERGGAATFEGGFLGWPVVEGHSGAGELAYGDFARLCWLFETLPLPASSGSWSCAITHRDDVELTIAAADGRTLVYQDYGESAPAAVELLVDAVEDTARALAWTPTNAER